MFRLLLQLCLVVLAVCFIGSMLNFWEHGLSSSEKRYAAVVGTMLFIKVVVIFIFCYYGSKKRREQPPPVAVHVQNYPSAPPSYAFASGPQSSILNFQSAGHHPVSQGV